MTFLLNKQKEERTRRAWLFIHGIKSSVTYRKCLKSKVNQTRNFYFVTVSRVSIFQTRFDNPQKQKKKKYAVSVETTL